MTDDDGEGTMRYQVYREPSTRRLRIVDCANDLEHPEAGAAVCFVGGDAESPVVQERAEIVARALNAYDLRVGCVPPGWDDDDWWSHVATCSRCSLIADRPAVVDA